MPVNLLVYNRKKLAFIHVSQRYLSCAITLDHIVRIFDNIEYFIVISGDIVMVFNDMYPSLVSQPYRHLIDRIYNIQRMPPVENGFFKCRFISIAL